MPLKVHSICFLGLFSGLQLGPDGKPSKHLQTMGISSNHPGTPPVLATFSEQVMGGTGVTFQEWLDAHPVEPAEA